MKKAFTIMLLLAVSVCMHSTLFAAQLRDVKPIVAGSSVSVEISADSAMTYTYYKVPGQARAVVDIAAVDPDKIEPLIVVNKGVVSSISVDSAQISGIVVSRIIFNLVTEADISVTSSPDRTLLVVTFDGSAPAAGVPNITPELKPELKHEATPVVVAKNGQPAAAVTTPVTSPVAPATAAPQEEDPLGLDEPAAQPAAPACTVGAKTSTGDTELSAAPTVTRIPKLEPVVPIASAPPLPAALKVKEIVTGQNYIEIRANQSVQGYKIMKLSGPDRLVIDIPCEKADQRPNVTTINKFGISKVRTGVSPKNIRIVMDSSRVGFPVYTIATTEDGVRIYFK